MGEPFKKGGWEITDVDWDGRFGADVVEDITKWDYKAAFEPGHFDVVWASPDCRMYSMARTRGGPRNFESSDLLVQTCIDIIQYLQPRCWWLENPDSGMLKGRSVVEGLPYVRVDYCMYQDPVMYRKRTRLWTNCTDWKPKLCDRSHLVDGRKHPSSAQRGFKKVDKRSGDKTFSRDQLHRLPKALCEEIFAVCSTL